MIKHVPFKVDLGCENPPDMLILNYWSSKIFKPKEIYFLSGFVIPQNNASMFDRLAYYVHPNQWSQLPVSVEGKGLGAQKKNILLSQFSVLILVVSALHIPIDAYNKVNYGLMGDVGLVLGGLGLWLLNEQKYHVTAKAFMIVFLNAALWIYITNVPEKPGVSLMYLPIICGTYMGFGYKQVFWRTVLSLIPTGLFLTYQLTFYPVLYEALSLPQGQFYFVINTLSAAAVMIFTIRFLNDINYKCELELRTSRQETKFLAEELSGKNIALEQTVQELDKFAHHVSHDLKSPLRSIMGLVNIANAEPVDQCGYYLNRINTCALRLDGFINDVMDYSVNAKTAINKEHMDFPELIDEILENLKFMEKAEDINFQVNVNRERKYYSDPNRMRIIISNLVSNAIKYHNYDQANPQVHIKVTHGKDHFTITVSDNGLGIEEQLQPKLFDKFYRATQHAEGFGLGLSIVKEAVDKLEGTIALQSTKEIGATFTIIIPQ